MNATTTAITLRDTGHVLATYTQKSQENSGIASEETIRRFSNGLHLRLLPHYLKRTRIATESVLESASTELKVKSADSIKGIVAENDIFDVHDGSNFATFRVEGIAPEADPSQAKLTISLIDAPQNAIAAGQELSPIADKSPADKKFTFSPRHLDAVDLEPTKLPLVSRPTSLSVIDGQIIETPLVGEGVDYVQFSIKQTGVDVMIYPFKGDGATSPDKTISFDTPAVCVMLTPDRQTVLSSVEIPARQEAGLPAVATIPFAIIPSGEIQFLFLLKGFQPIWDKLRVSGRRTWTPISIS